MVKHVLFPFYFQTSLQCRLSWFKVTLSTRNKANMAPAGIAVYDRGISTITVVLLLATCYFKVDHFFWLKVSAMCQSHMPVYVPDLFQVFAICWQDKLFHSLAVDKNKLFYEHRYYSEVLSTAVCAIWYCSDEDEAWCNQSSHVALLNKWMMGIGLSYEIEGAFRPWHFSTLAFCPKILRIPCK